MIFLLLVKVFFYCDCQEKPYFDLWLYCCGLLSRRKRWLRPKYEDASTPIFLIAGLDQI